MNRQLCLEAYDELKRTFNCIVEYHPHSASLFFLIPLCNNGIHLCSEDDCTTIAEVSTPLYAKCMAHARRDQQTWEQRQKLMTETNDSDSENAIATAVNHLSLETPELKKL